MNKQGVRFCDCGGGGKSANRRCFNGQTRGLRVSGSYSFHFFQRAFMLLEFLPGFAQFSL